jgi:hypothetical protein
MLRRNFFRWLSTSIFPLLLPKLGRAQASGLSDSDTPTVTELAAVVLPASLGRTKSDNIAKQFIHWTQGYKPGADAGYGYGYPAVEVLGANPATDYRRQIQQLETAAAARGGTFAGITEDARRAIVTEAIQQAGIDKIPPRPNGKHIASDMLAYFYNSAEGQDFLYSAAIRRDDCRGLENSSERPRSLS